MVRIFGARIGLLVCCAVACTAACASNSGVVSGVADTHCAGESPMPQSAFTCPTASADPNSADPNSAGMGSSDYGATMYNDNGNDDDCKYHVKWSATDVAENKDVTFTVSATWLNGGEPVTGANTIIEAYIPPIHPAPNSNPTTQEGPSGTYKIGPVQFDAKGQWTVRFHFFETCDDADNSLHGHAAFYVKVD